tara:strand:- start:2693 stop:5902 length:3210 start_codon:yes stop_codon:yes gene_type:complete
MNRNIIKVADPREVTTDENYLYFPVTINVENALNNNVRYLKLVVLPKEFNGINNGFQTALNYDNFPFNLNKDIGKIENDNKIDKNEVGSFSTPDFIKRVFSKNITTNLLQKEINTFGPNVDSEALTIFPDQNTGAFNEEFQISLSISKINRSLIKSITQFETGTRAEYYKHYFILYVLDDLNNIVEYRKILAPEGIETIDQYNRSTPLIIKESFIDKVGGSIDIEFRNLSWDESDVIRSGPYPKINYLNFLKFAESLNLILPGRQPKTTIDFEIILRYFSREDNEVSYRTVLQIPLISISDVSDPVAIANLINNAISGLNGAFARNLSEVIFLEEVSRSETEDISDYFDNKFFISLYKDFLNDEEDFKNVELTITYEDFSYTKDTVISRSNFTAYYNTVLLYYKEDIIRRTFLDKTEVTTVLNDLSQDVLKLEIQKFDYKNYSLNVVKDNMIMKFLQPSRSSQLFDKLFLDDNLTETNSINSVRNVSTQTGFYVYSVFESNDTSTLYLQSNIFQQSIIIKIDNIEIYRDVPIRIDNEENTSSDRLSQINAINNAMSDLRNTSRTRRNNNIDTQRILNQDAFDVQISNNNVTIQFKTSTTLNREIIQSEFDIQVNSDSIEDQIYTSRIENNTIICMNVFQTSPVRSFLGSINKHMSSIESLNGSKQISLQEEFNDFPNNSSLEIEVKFFLLNNGTLNNLGQNITEDQKEDICQTLSSLRPDQYHYIVRNVENNWFSTTLQKNEILNQFGSLLINTNLVESTTIESTKETSQTTRKTNVFKSSNKTEKQDIKQPNKKIKKQNVLRGSSPLINSSSLIKQKSLRTPTTSIKRTPTTSIKSTPITNSTRNIKSSNSLNYITDFNFDNLNVEDIELNAIISYKSSSFNAEKIKKNKNYIYKINLNKNNSFSNSIKSREFRALNVYSCYAYSFYNNTSRISRDEMLELNVNNQGVLIDIEFIDIIRSYEFKIENQSLLIDKTFRKALNFNERYYEKAKYIWANNNKLMLKSIYNRVVFEILHSDGEKYFYAVNLNVPLKNSSKSNKDNNINKSNLSININNNVLYNPNIILTFNK